MWLCERTKELSRGCTNLENVLALRATLPKCRRHISSARVQGKLDEIGVWKRVVHKSFGRRALYLDLTHAMAEEDVLSKWVCLKTIENSFD